MVSYKVTILTTVEANSEEELEKQVYAVCDAKAYVTEIEEVR